MFLRPPFPCSLNKYYCTFQFFFILLICEGPEQWSSLVSRTLFNQGYTQGPIAEKNLIKSTLVNILCECKITEILHLKIFLLRPLIHMNENPNLDHSNHRCPSKRFLCPRNPNQSPHSSCLYYISANIEIKVGKIIPSTNLHSSVTPTQ